MSLPTGILCPAYRCKPGSHLLGVRQEDGTIAILPQTLPVDQDFIDKTSGHVMTPEQRFRFTNRCIEGGCMQWNGTGCKVADKMVNYLESIIQEDELPSCSIRNQCRWFLQKGADGCRVCTYVVTEITAEEIQSANS
jgi:hypothetical protein